MCAIAVLAFIGRGIRVDRTDRDCDGAVGVRPK